ncbi:hypothetical protein BGZ60DRAFT_395186 [Tricladium varicosporioides]|nr:hypothetical protein BGZ60DRAFT_395186 [Hymenoscyphus varicosporioides]
MASKIKYLTLLFKCRDQPGEIHITLQPNLDPVHAWGLDLIYPSIPASSFQDQFFGFPVIHAEIEYPTLTPESQHSGSGYGSLFGWIQVVKTVKLDDKATDNWGEWEMDIYPSFKQGSNSPFAYWGHKPALFDAPARLLRKDQEYQGLKWRAQSFLCIIEDAGLGRSVRVCPGGGFGWGFDIDAIPGNKGGTSREIHIVDAKPLDLETEWDGRVDLLRRLYPDWAFN